MAVPLVLIAEFLFRIFHLHKTCLLTKKNGLLWNGDWMHKLEYVLDEVTYVKIGDRMLLFFRFMHESVSWMRQTFVFCKILGIWYGVADHLAHTYGQSTKLIQGSRAYKWDVIGTVKSWHNFIMVHQAYPDGLPHLWTLTVEKICVGIKSCGYQKSVLLMYGYWFLWNVRGFSVWFVIFVSSSWVLLLVSGSSTLYLCCRWWRRRMSSHLVSINFQIEVFVWQTWELRKCH